MEWRSHYVKGVSRSADSINLSKATVGTYLLQQIGRLQKEKSEYTAIIEAQKGILDQYIQLRTILLQSLSATNMHDLTDFVHREKMHMCTQEGFFRDILRNMQFEIDTSISQETEKILNRLEEKSTAISHIGATPKIVNETSLSIAVNLQRWEYEKILENMKIEDLFDWEDFRKDKYYELLYKITGTFHGKSEIVRTWYSDYCSRNDLLNNGINNRKERINLLNSYDRMYREKSLGIEKDIFRKLFWQTKSLNTHILSQRIIMPQEEENILAKSWDKDRNAEKNFESPLLRRMIEIMRAHFKDEPNKKEYVETMLRNFRHNFCVENTLFHVLFSNKNNEAHFDNNYDNIVAFLRIMDFGAPGEKIIGSVFIESFFRWSGAMLMFKQALAKEFISGVLAIHLDVEPESRMEEIWKGYGFKQEGVRRMIINQETGKEMIFNHYKITKEDFFRSHNLEWKNDGIL